MCGASRSGWDGSIPGYVKTDETQDGGCTASLLPYTNTCVSRRFPVDTRLAQALPILARASAERSFKNS